MANDKYANPWREKEMRAARAKRVYEYMQQKHAADTESAVMRTIPYSVSNCKELFVRQQAPGAHLPPVSVLLSETVAAAFCYPGKKVAILNFASYKNPGGMFMEGSIAQEESLCHSSNLYNILSSERLQECFYIPNRKQLNYGLYSDNLLYTPDVLFIHDKKRQYCDVITAAAPNKGVAQKYHAISDERCRYAMRSRIQHILLAALNNQVDVLILGAYGTGVFKNDSKEVASLFREELVGCPFTAVFAIPGEKSLIFSEIFGVPIMKI